MKELVIEADNRNLPKVQAFVDEQLEETDCPMLTQTAINIAVEELFVNIANYAYYPETGIAVVQVTVHENPLSVEITFIDSGKQYDPLERADPDITVSSAKQRKKGGLGIFMVRKSMDNVNYEYKDGKKYLHYKEESELSRQCFERELIQKNVRIRQPKLSHHFYGVKVWVVSAFS